MAIEKEYLEDVETILSHRHDNGADLWVVERVVPKLAKLNFYKKGEPSELATRRYNEILDNLKM